MQEKLPQGISKDKTRYRIHLSVNGKCYYLGSAHSLADAKKIHKEAVSMKKQGKFEKWYIANYDSADFEKKRQGKYFNYDEVSEITGIKTPMLAHYTKLLGLNPLKRKTKKYFSLQDLEKLKEKGRMAGIKDITGKKIGFLKAVRMHEFIFGQHTLWEWKCSCGNTLIAPEITIERSSHKSCGCKYTRIRKKNEVPI